MASKNGAFWALSCLGRKEHLTIMIDAPTGRNGLIAARKALLGPTVPAELGPEVADAKPTELLQTHTPRGPTKHPANKSKGGQFAMAVAYGDPVPTEAWKEEQKKGLSRAASSRSSVSRTTLTNSQTSHSGNADKMSFGDVTKQAMLAARRGRRRSVMLFKKFFTGKRDAAWDAAVQQAMGSLGNAWLVDDNLRVPQRVLSYRLASLDSTSPWGDGLLLSLARSTPDDTELHAKVMALLDEPWKSDPIRQKALTDLGEPIGIAPSSYLDAHPDSRAEELPRGFELLKNLATSGRLARTLRSHTDTWGKVLLSGRGAVGETVLHLCCLLLTEQHRRIIRILVPWLAQRSTADQQGRKVMALDASYLGQPYNGEVALHFAVIKQERRYVHPHHRPLLPTATPTRTIALCFPLPRPPALSPSASHCHAHWHHRPLLPTATSTRTITLCPPPPLPLPPLLPASACLPPPLARCITPLVMYRAAGYGAGQAAA